MDRYTIDGFILGALNNLPKEIQDQQWKLFETLENALYYHFDNTRHQSEPEFHAIINGVELECEYKTEDNQIWYIVTRIDTQQQERYLFMAEPDDIDDSVLADDIAQARLVTLWAAAGCRY